MRRPSTWLAGLVVMALPLGVAAEEEAVPEPEPVAEEEEPIELPAPDPTETASRNTGMATAGYVLAGLGLVGIVTGAVTGAVSLVEESAATDGCPAACPDDAREHHERADNFGHAAIASLAVGGAALVLGIVLAVVDPGDSAEVAADRLTIRF